MNRGVLALPREKPVTGVKAEACWLPVSAPASTAAGGLPGFAERSGAKQGPGVKAEPCSQSQNPTNPNSDHKCSSVEQSMASARPHPPFISVLRTSMNRGVLTLPLEKPVTGVKAEAGWIPVNAPVITAAGGLPGFAERSGAKQGPGVKAEPCSLITGLGADLDHGGWAPRICGTARSKAGGRGSKQGQRAPPAPAHLRASHSNEPGSPPSSMGKIYTPLTTS